MQLKSYFFLVVRRQQPQISLNSSVLGSGLTCPGSVVVTTCEVTDSDNIVSIDVEQPGEQVSKFLFAGGPKVIPGFQVTVAEVLELGNPRRFTSTFFSFPPNDVTQTCKTGNVSNSLEVKASGKRKYRTLNFT